jgi:hypothetical protein
MDNRRFHSFFNARQDIFEMVWDMLGEGGLCPEKSKPKHLLWACYFMKVYLREGPECSAVCGSKSAINPNVGRDTNTVQVVFVRLLVNTLSLHLKLLALL